jgi:hypothetical protein
MRGEVSSASPARPLEAPSPCPENSARHESEKDSHSHSRAARLPRLAFAILRRQAKPRNSKARPVAGPDAGRKPGKFVFWQNQLSRNQTPSQAENHVSVKGLFCAGFRPSRRFIRKPKEQIAMAEKQSEPSTALPFSARIKTACIVNLRAEIDRRCGVPYGWLKIYKVLRMPCSPNFGPASRPAGRRISVPWHRPSAPPSREPRSTLAKSRPRQAPRAGDHRRRQGQRLIKASLCAAEVAGTIREHCRGENGPNDPKPS